MEQVYPENDTSAFKRRVVTLADGSHVQRVVRPEFRRVLDDLTAGRVDSLIAYDLDRVCRDPRDLEDLIDVAESRRLTGLVKSVTGSLRLDNDADITMARVMVAMANKSSRDTARRVSRAAKQRAEQGGFHGGRPAFGYEHVKEAKRVVGWNVHAEHAAWLREAAGRLLAGESLYGICSDWTAQGRVTGNGVHWRSQTLKRALTSYAVIGMREYQGKPYPAKWKPILDPETWERLRTLLNDPARLLRPFDGSGNARKFALSGLLVCGRCGHRLTSQPYNGKATFICSKQATGGCGRLRIGNEDLEAFIVEAAFAALDSPQLAQAMNAGDNASEEERGLREALRADREALKALADERDDGFIPDATEYRRRRARIEAKIDAGERRIAELTNRVVLNHLPKGDEARKLWAKRDVSWRRTLLSHLIEKVVIAPFPEGVTTNLTRRKNESDEDFAARRDEWQVKVLLDRVEIKWKV